MLAFAEDRTLDRNFSAFRARSPDAAGARGWTSAARRSRRRSRSAASPRRAWRACSRPRRRGSKAPRPTFRPRCKQDLPDPSSLTDMDAAAARLADAVVAQRSRSRSSATMTSTGATSAALLHAFFRRSAIAPRIYIPDRIFEGYGPNVTPSTSSLGGGRAADRLRRLRLDQLRRACERAKERGIDVIVLDHHQVGRSCRLAFAIVNPSRRDDVSGQGQRSPPSA